MPARLPILLNRRATSAGQGGGLAYTLLRDLFSTAQDPLIDGPAVPGAGARDATGTLWKALASRLRGGAQPSSPTWGNSKVVWTVAGGAGFARATGRTLYALIAPEDASDDLAFGWASATNVADPTTDGLAFLNDGGSLAATTPGKKVVIDPSGHFVRPIQYLIGVTLNDIGAIMWLSTFSADTGGGGMTDQVGVPQYPSARVIWVDYADTTATLYPLVSALDSVGSYPNGHAIEDVRMVDVTAWSAADALASFTDRFTRADSNTTPGNNWVATAGVWGISSNALYNVSGSGFRTVYQPSVGSGDGIYQWKVTLSGTATDLFRLTMRHSTAGNYITLNSNGSTGALSLQIWVAGGFSSTIANFTLVTTLTANSTHVFTLLASGNKYALYQNGSACNAGAWSTDAGSTYLGAGGIGVGVANSNPTVFRFDDVQIWPLTFTIPAQLQTGAVPSIWTAGATLGSDTFTDTNGTNLTAHTPTAGSAWTARIGTWTIQSNRATCSTPTVGANGVTQAAATSDVEASIDIITPGSFPTNTVRAGIMLRYVDNSNYMYARLYKDAGTSEIELTEVIGGSGAIVHKVDIQAAGVVAATTYTLKVQAKGGLVQVFLGGLPRISYYTQAGSPLGTSHGIYREDTDDGCVFDTWSVKAL